MNDQEPSDRSRLDRAVGVAGGAAAAGVDLARNLRSAAAPADPHRPSLLDDTDTAGLGVVRPGGDPEALAIVAMQLLIADHAASREADEERRAKMERVLVRQHGVLEELHLDPKGATRFLARYGEDLSVTERIGLLVDGSFLDPFAPYTLKSSKRVRAEALERIADLIGGDAATVAAIDDTRRRAVRSHRLHSIGKVGWIGIGAAVTLGIVGFMAAPLLGAALGAGAGLSGAAATAHGLALLGGGSLAAGGAGMAGGMWLVAGAGAAAGLIAGGGGTALYQLGSATARGELIKLQITFKLGVIDTQRDMVKAQEIIANLAAQADETRALLDEERHLNETNAKRVSELETTLEDIEQTIDWMEREQTAAAARE